MAGLGFSTFGNHSLTLVASRVRTKWTPYALLAGFAFALTIIVLGVLSGPGGKIDANGIISPWDRSPAPEYVGRAGVRVVKTGQPPSRGVIPQSKLAKAQK